MNTPKKLVGDTYEFYLDDRGFYFLRLRDGEEFGMGDVDEVHRYIENELGGQVRPSLIELGYGSTIGDDVQEYLVKVDNRFSSADAILISTYAHKLITKYYLLHYKPTKPTKVFDDIFDALEWIENL